MKRNVIVIYGGKSVEHDVSIITALQTMENIDKNEYNFTPVYISKSGNWYTLDKYEQIDEYKNIYKAKKKIVSLLSGKPYLCIKSLFGYKVNRRIDCAILCIHGTNCEDGSLQGSLESSNIPYTCCGVTSSAIGMDKILMKDIFRANNIPCVNYTYVLKNIYEQSGEKFIASLKLKFPLIVKPSNLGSSVGINRCENREDLKRALDVAFYYDTRVIIEEVVSNAREINCAVLGNCEECETSQLEEPVNWKNYLTFDDKYILGKKKKNEKDLVLDKKIKNQIRSLAKKTFKIFCCAGVVRIDFLLDENNNVYVNELNTIPGSLAFYLWKHSFKEHITKLVNIAIKEKQIRDRLNYDYDSSCLDNYKKGTKGSGK